MQPVQISGTTSSSSVALGSSEAPNQSLLRNPFDLRPALAMPGSPSLAITAAMDVDPAIITMHCLPGGALDVRVAGLILATPILLNTLVKAGITMVFGGWARGSRAALPLFASIVASVVALVVVVSGNYA